jgi:eukaryotic-like serine/threonine-protein kinase
VVTGSPASEPRRLYEQAGQRSGTVLFQGPSTPISGVNVRPAALTPARLADLMLVAPLVRRAGLTLLEPDGDMSTLSIFRGRLTVAEVRVVADVGNAAAARLAVLAGLDPLAESNTLEGNGNMGRAMVRVGLDVAEVLVSISASARGIEARVRPLSINGRPPDLRGQAQLKRCARCGAFQAGAQQTCEVDDGALVDVEDAPTPGGTVGVYRVLENLGEGGGGAVFAGEHALLGRPVAIKLLHRRLAQNPELARRFLSEARAASRLRHPNVVDVTDFGVLDDGRPYMVMERLHGEPLDKKLARSGPLDPAAALLVAREVALALGAAHDGGLAHNDLKPSNVIVLDGSTDEAPKLKLIDFGAASLVGTTEELLCGTPAYMAPERVLTEPSDGRADLYALGVMLYEMIAGAKPFVNPTLRGLLLAQVREPLPALESPFGVLPQAVLRLVARAVSKKADERQQSAGELVAEIDRALSDLGRVGSRRWLP